MAEQAYFDDPRHRESEDLAWEAEIHARKARDAYAKAAELEEALFRDYPADGPRMKVLIGRSAAALWYNAHDYAKAIALGEELHRDFPMMSSYEGREILDLVTSSRSAVQRENALVLRSGTSQDVLEAHRARGPGARP